MIELKLIIWDRLMAHLANLPIAPHNLKHDILRDVSSGPSPSFGLGEAFGDKENRADMTEDTALKFGGVILHDPPPSRRVRVQKAVACIGQPIVGACTSVGKHHSSLRTNQADVEKRAFVRGKWKLLNEWPIWTVLELPAGLAYW